MNKRLQVIKYIIADVLSAAIAWTLFYFFRKLYIERPAFGLQVPLELSRKFYLGLTLIPLFWLGLYYLSGAYRSIYRRSRLKELGQTFLISIIGVIVIFFSLLLDDAVDTYKTYYTTIFILFTLHFILTASFRFFLTTKTNHKIHRREIGFNTILIGSNANAFQLYQEMAAQPKSSGNLFTGFVHIDEKNGFSQQLKQFLPHLGEYYELKKIIKENNTEEVIIAIESSEHDSIGKIINELEDTNVIIKIIPDMYDILAGSVKMSSIFGAPLITISREIMPAWQQSFKRFLDVSISLFVLVVFFPVYFALAIMVKLTSKGPVFYSHERIGWHGKPFFIHKYRSMFVDAEKNGPALSSANDARITPFGKFLRKMRLDEIPQFYNVLIGEMSMVGPRPERQFFIDQIVQKAPHYKHLHKVRPGITSWGQIKYGYAENVDQMIARLKYDILYIENMSIYVDIKILIYTILIVLQGRGK